MSDYAVLTLLLSITAFYVFLAIYILVHILSARTPSLAKVTDKTRQETLREDSEAEINSRLW